MFATRMCSSIAVRVGVSTSANRVSIYYRGIVQTRKYSTPVDLPVPNKTKVWDSAEEAVKGDAIKSGDTLLCGGAFARSNYLFYVGWRLTAAV
jgi:hypothetical protein